MDDIVYDVAAVSEMGALDAQTGDGWPRDPSELAHLTKQESEAYWAGYSSARAAIREGRGCVTAPAGSR